MVATSNNNSRNSTKEAVMVEVVINILLEVVQPTTPMEDQEAVA